MVSGLGDSLRPVTAPGRPALVRTPISGLWLTATSPRVIDAPVLDTSPDHDRWLAAMDDQAEPMAGRLGLEGRLETEVLQGEAVEVHDLHGDWAFVTCPEQPSHKNPRGYPGYLRADHLDLDGADDAVVVTDRAPTTGATSVDRAAFLDAVRAHVGVTYLWAGLSPLGLDSSGLVHLPLRGLGVLFPRDCSDQARQCAPIDPADVAPGDLLFFARPGAEPDHVGIVSAPGRMLHAPQAGRVVEEDVPPDLVETLAGAGRISALE
ncbi:NlpC/P60 family protein [Allobranchiibius sp. CTAmp26]|uniref:C40 family peptidase n=1 Tax=Allobranchiibius sp. CTAmp26 TaxID=2815214 RepID=UPI001AA0E4E7|nr:NlpC/P60 family protein [Allobranchiibius sp. CTAmp26]MBO1754097.1 C40 family peptidase [Allobranchiibius sp. CTAmp26]